MVLPRCAVTRGRTDENPRLPRDFRQAMRDMYGDTRLGRQELEGLLLEDHEGALGTRNLLEKARFTPSPCRGEGQVREPNQGEGLSYAGDAPPCPHPSAASRLPPSPLQGEGFRRIVIGLDPPASTGGDSCGSAICGKDEEGTAWVISDLKAAGLSLEAWTRRVAEAAVIPDLIRDPPSSRRPERKGGCRIKSGMTR